MTLGIPPLTPPLPSSSPPPRVMEGFHGTLLTLSQRIIEFKVVFIPPVAVLAMCPPIVLVVFSPPVVLFVPAMCPPVAKTPWCTSSASRSFPSRLRSVSLSSVWYALPGRPCREKSKKNYITRGLMYCVQ